MSTKTRQVIWGGKIMGAEMRAAGAREAAQKAIREADRAEAEAWSVRLEGYEDRRSRHRPLANVKMVGWTGWRSNAIAARRGQAYLSTPSADRATRRSGSWRASLKRRSCRKGRHAPPVHMIRLTETREMTPYKWVHPDEDR